MAIEFDDGLNERCPNVWHMLIERLILFKLIRSGVQVSNW